jgi:outer membrane protein
MKQLLTALLCAVLGAGTASAVAQSVKVAFIDAPRLERESKRIQRLSEQLKKEFATREQELRELQKRVNAAQADLEKSKATAGSADALRREREFTALAQRFEQTGRTFNEDLERRKNEERSKFMRDVTVIVQKIAEAQKIDLVVQEVVYAARSADLTDQVMKALDAGN